MRAMKRKVQRGILSVCAGAMALQFGGCRLDLSEITVASAATVDIRDVLVGLIREAIITPIDIFVTEGVNTAFDAIDDRDDN